MSGYVTVESTKAQPSTDPALILGGAGRLLMLGWRPRHDLAETLRDMLDTVGDGCGDAWVDRVSATPTELRFVDSLTEARTHRDE